MGSKLRSKINFFLWSAFFLILSQGVWAHDLDTSYVGLSAQTGRVDLTLTLDAEQSAKEFGPITEASALVLLTEYARSRVLLEVDGRRVLLNWTVSAGDSKKFEELFLDQRTSEIDHASDFGKTLYLHLEASASLANELRTATLSADFYDRYGEQHTTLVKMAREGRVETAILRKDAPQATFSPVQEEQRSLLRQDLQFVRLGIEHILLGVDHLLFLLALLVIGGCAASLIKIVTSFTVAHSLTLTLAVLGWVALPSRLVESAIALSIVYVGLENFFVQSMSHRWIVTFFFGLVHGFGFAAALNELGLPARGLLRALLSFNVGVETGQLAIVAVLTPAIWALGRSRFRLTAVRAVSACVVLLGMVWFLERSFNLQGLF